MKKGCKSCSRVISTLEGTLPRQRVQLDDMPRVRSLGSRWKVHRSAKTVTPGTRCTEATSQLGLCCWAKCQFHLRPGRSLPKFAEQRLRPEKTKSRRSGVGGSGH